MYVISYACKNGPGNENLYLGEPEFAPTFQAALQQAEERVIENIGIDLNDDDTVQELTEEVQSNFAEAKNTGSGWAYAWSGGATSEFREPYEVAVSVAEVPDSA